jgi:DNA-binding MarR family transcriptional regulator
MSRRDSAQRAWTLITNHGAVLLVIAENPDRRVREIAEQVGITQRTAQMILADLVDAGYVRRFRVGRRNHYSIDPGKPLRHQVVRMVRVADLLAVLDERDAMSG